MSPKLGGPRGTTTPHPDRNLDAYDNLILLCPSDHSLVDQLVAEFDEGRLREMKAAHAKWVRESLDSPARGPVVLKRGSPAVLLEVLDAATLVSIVAGAEESSLDNEEPLSESEADEVGGLLQTFHDWGEIWSDLEPASRVRASFEIRGMLDDARAHGWRVFGARAHGTLSGGVSDAASTWDTAYIRVVRADSPEIVSVDPSRTADPDRRG